MQDCNSFSSGPSRLMTAIATIATAVTTTSALGATNYSWNSASQSNWNTPGNWSPAAVPTSGDNIVTPTQFGAITMNVAAPGVANWTHNSATGQTIIGLNGTAGSTLTISGTLTKSGASTMLIRDGSNNPLTLNVGALVLSQGNLELGAFNNATQSLTSFTAGSATISGSSELRLNVIDGNANITGDLSLSGTSRVFIRNLSNAAGTLEVGSLNSTDTTPVILANNFASAASTGTLAINTTGGIATYAGAIQISTSNNVANSVSVIKSGVGTQVFSGNSNTYNGGTIIDGGTLLLNNVSGSGTGSGAVTVNNTGTLGGTGRIAPSGTNGVTINAGGILAPGASIENLEINLANTTGKLTVNTGGGFDFELGTAGASIATPGSGDLLILSGASAGDVVFSNNVIDFKGTGAQGWYKLFDTDLPAGTTWAGLTLSGQQIIGGLSVSNLAPGLAGTLVVGDGAGNGDRDDIYLNVAVPEPTTAALLGLGVLGLSRRRR